MTTYLLSKFSLIMFESQECHGNKWMLITDMQIQGGQLIKGPTCWALEYNDTFVPRLYLPQAAAPDQWLNARDIQAKPFFGDRDSEDRQLWREGPTALLNVP